MRVRSLIFYYLYENNYYRFSCVCHSIGRVCPAGIGWIDVSANTSIATIATFGGFHTLDTTRKSMAIFVCDWNVQLYHHNRCVGCTIE